GRLGDVWPPTLAGTRRPAPPAGPEPHGTGRTTARGAPSGHPPPPRPRTRLGDPARLEPPPPPRPRVDPGPLITDAEDGGFYDDLRRLPAHFRGRLHGVRARHPGGDADRPLGGGHRPPRPVPADPQGGDPPARGARPGLRDARGHPRGDPGGLPRRLGGAGRGGGERVAGAGAPSVRAVAGGPWRSP